MFIRFKKGLVNINQIDSIQILGSISFTIVLNLKNGTVIAKSFKTEESRNKYFLKLYKILNDYLIQELKF
jgi:hypothetical protein